MYFYKTDTNNAFNTMVEERIIKDDVCFLASGSQIILSGFIKITEAEFESQRPVTPPIDSTPPELEDDPQAEILLAQAETLLTLKEVEETLGILLLNSVEVKANV